MKLRLPHKLQAALIATLASAAFTTLSSGTLAVATGAALLAGQQAQAEESPSPLDDAVKVYDGNIASTLVVDDWTATTMTVAVELDVQAVKNRLTTTWIAGSKSVDTIFNVQGTWNGNSNTYYEGINFNGSTGSRYASPYLQVTSPNGSKNNQAAASVSETLKFNASTPWDDYASMAVVLTFNGGDQIGATWVIQKTDGSYLEYSGTTSGIKFGGSTAFTPNGTLANVYVDMVDYVAVFDEVKDGDASKSIAKAVFAREGMDYGMEFSGDVFTIEHATYQTFHNATFSSWYQDENGRWRKGSHTWGGGDSTYYVGEEAHTLHATKNNSFWRQMFGDASDGGDKAMLGNTIRLTRATGDVYYESQFSPYQLGGIIAEEGNSGTYVLGRPGSCAIHIKARAGEEANMYVASNLGLSSNTSIDIESSGTWKVFDGKSLTLALYNSTSNLSSIVNTPKITFNDGVTVSMVGGGTVDMTHTGNLTVQSGATINVGEGTQVKFAAGTTLAGTINNEGTVTFSGAVGGLAHTISNEGTITFNGTVTLGSLSLFESEGTYVDYSGATGAQDGFAGDMTYTIIKGNGQYDNLQTVSYNSTNYTVDGGKISVTGSTDFSTYHLNTNGADLDLAQAMATASNQLTTVEAKGTNQTITVGSEQNLANLNLLAGASVTTSGTGTLTLGALSNGGTLNIGSKVTMGTVAFTSSDAPAIHVTEGGVYTILSNSTVDTKPIGSGTGTGEAANNAFTNLFTGRVVDVQDGGRLVLQGNVISCDTSVSGTPTQTSGVAAMEITGNLQLNTWGNGCTWALGSRSLEVGGNFWLTNKQYLTLNGGTLGVDGQLLLGHKDNTGSYPASVTATGNSSITLGGIGLYGPGNAFSLTGGSLTFNTASAATNVLTNEGSNAHNNNTITLAGTTLHAGENGWTLAPVDGATVSVSGTTTVDVASGKQISLSTTSVNGKFVFAEGSTGTLLLNSANGVLTEGLALNGATVGFAGTWNLTALDDGSATPTYTGGENPGNGFAKLVTTVQLADLTQGGSITADSASATFTIKGVTGQLNTADGTVTTSGEPSYDTFHVLTGSENVSQGRKDSHDPIYSLANETTLVVDADLTGAKLTREPGATGNATLEIQANRTYTSDGNAKTITITGAGTYALKSGTFAMVDSLAQGEDGWTGTVVITNAGNKATIDEESLVNGTYSTLQMEGFNGWFSGTHWYGERNQNIKLVDYVNASGNTVSAWTNGAFSGSNLTLKFTGTWSGSGTFERVGGSDMDYDYSGNIAAWDGKFLMSGNGTTDLRFYGAANTVNAAIDRTNGTLNVEVGDGTNAFTATFNKAVNASKLEIKDGASATFEKAVTLNGDLSLRGTETARASVLLKEGATLNSNLDLSNARSSHGTVTVAADKVLDLKGTNFWMSSNSSIVLQENATFKKGTELTVTGLSGAASTITNANSGDDVYGLDKAGYTLTNVQATVNTDSDDVQLHFDNSKFVTSHTVTLKNLESVFSGMEIGGGTTTVGASGLTESATVQLGAVSLSNGGTLALANHVTGSVSGVEVEGSGTISGGTLQMGRDALITLGDNAVLTLSGVTVDLGSKELQGGGTRYDYGQNEGNGFAITEGKVQLVDYATGSAIDQGTGVSYKYGSNSGTLITEGADQGYVTFGDASYSAFYVNTPNTVESLSVAVEKSIGQPTGPLAEVYLKAGTLNTDGAEPINALHIDSGDGTVYLTGEAAGFFTLDGRGTLNVAAATNLNGYTLSVAAGETLTLEGGATISYSHIANRGTLGIGTDTTVATTNDIVVNAGETFTTTGEGKLTGTSLTVYGDASLGADAEFSGDLNPNSGSLTIGGHTTVNGTMHGGDLVEGKEYKSAAILVESTGVLDVTNISANWGFSSFTVNGALNVANELKLTTGNATYTVDGSGTITTKKLTLNNEGKYVFDGTNGLTLVVGEGGISAGNGNRTLTLANGLTVKASADWTMDQNAMLNGTVNLNTQGNDLTISSVLSNAANTTGGLAISGGGTLALNGGNSFSGGLTVTGTTVEMGNNNALGNANNAITIGLGGVIDLKGHDNVDYAYTLAGGTLQNTGNATGAGMKQTKGLTLTANSTIGGTGDFHIIAGDYAATTINLGNKTLTKTGDNTVYFVNSDITEGTLQVNAGALGFTHRDNKPDSRVQADIVLNGGTITGGAFKYADSAEAVTRNLTVNQSAVTSAAITIGNNVTLAANVAENQVLTLGGSITGTGNFSLSSTGTLKLAGADMISVGSLTLGDGATLDVSNIAQMAGITVNLASYTGSASYSNLNITGLNSGLTYSLTDDGSHVALTFAGTPVPPPTPTSPDLGNVMYVGDSITDGVTSGSDHAKSWRYSFFQVLADGGIAQNEEGYFQHHQTSGAIPEGTIATYGGRDFQNTHSAQSSARSYEVSGTEGPSKVRFDRSYIKNWLGQDETKKNGQPYPTDKPRYSGADAPNTYFMLLGTNDLLSEGGANNHVTEDSYNTVLSRMFGYNGSSFDGETGSFDVIWDAMTTARSDSKLIVMEMPTWNPSRSGNHDNASDFAYMAKFNQKLHEWANSKESSNITVVNPNPGIVDVANTTKPGAGVANMFLSDGLHPSAQGELIIAGNVAKQLGYAGRTVGLDRANSSTQGTTWTTESATITVGTEAQVFAENAFHTRDGYTIDFGAIYGNGFSGGWSASANALSVQVGDGYHTGTLTFSEAYVMWGDQILYSRDNSQTSDDNFRIAYVNQSVNASDNVTAGYYVWMGDQLIGEALTAGSDEFNGISLTSTGAEGTVKNLTWSDTAYAPTTTLYENPDSEALFHLTQVNPNPHHDNPEHSSLNIDFTDATPVSGRYGVTSGNTDVKLISSSTTATKNQWIGPVGGAHSGTVEMEYSNLQAPDNNIIVVYGGKQTGNVSLVLDNGTHIGKGEYSGTGQQSIHGSYQRTIEGDLNVEVNNATLDGGIIMGVINATGTIANTNLYVNAGAAIGDSVYGGNFSANGTISGNASITVTGGTINGSVYGGNKGNGTISGNTSVTITGGVITGDVKGGGTGGTVTGSTNVTVVGNLPSIGGNVSAGNVTLKDVAPNEDGYTDGFDCYRGTITATTLTLNNYTVGEMLATVTASNLALTGGTSTTINKLDTTVGTAISVDATSSLTLGQANLSAAIANAGTLVLTQDITSTGLECTTRDYNKDLDGNEVSVETTNANYFAGAQEGTLTVVGGNGALTSNNHKVVQGGVTYTLGDNGKAVGTIKDVNYSTFYLHEADSVLTLSAINAVVPKGLYLSTVDIQGATLDIDEGIAWNVVANNAKVLVHDGGYALAIHVAGGTNEIVIDGGEKTELYDVMFTAGEAEKSISLKNANGDYSVDDNTTPNVRITSLKEDAVRDGAVTVTAAADAPQSYAANSAAFDVNATRLEKVANGNVTVNNTLNVRDIHNNAANTTGDFILTQGVDAAALENVIATSGNIEFQNMSDTDQANLNTLEIGAGKSVSMYTGSIAEAAYEASVTVSGTLSADAGATLNANLEMAAGSHLDVSGAQSTMGLLMGSEVTLNSNSYLDITKDPVTGESITVGDVNGFLRDYLTTGGHELYYLYSGTENDPLSLKIDGKQVEQLTFTDWQHFDKDASEVYANLQAQTFYMVYDGSNVGMVAIGLIPEPTTSTLSLLALAALAARRRRK